MGIVNHALTTVARVKSRLDIATGTTTWDALLAELINAATDFIEGECGGRRFATQAVTNETHSLDDGQKIVVLRNPPATITSIYHKTGTPGTPAWTALTTEDYELEDDGKYGVLHILNGASGTNAIRANYTGGYTTGFGTNHNLPYDVSDLCERLVVWAFKRRDHEGKSSDSAQEAAVSWREAITSDDRRIIRRYSRQAFA